MRTNGPTFCGWWPKHGAALLHSESVKTRRLERKNKGKLYERIKTMAWYWYVSCTWNLLWSWGIAWRIRIFNNSVLQLLVKCEITCMEFTCPNKWVNCPKLVEVGRPINVLLHLLFELLTIHVAKLLKISILKGSDVFKNVLINHLH